jgi:hypothetical protein
MRAVLIAATLAAIAAPASAGLDTALIRPSNPLLDQHRSQEACTRMIQQTADDGRAKLKRLDQLPWGLIEHAVLRSVGGCPVREVVYQGQTYWLQGTQPQVDRANPMGERLQKQK